MYKIQRKSSENKMPAKNRAKFFKGAAGPPLAMVRAKD